MLNEIFPRVPHADCSARTESDPTHSRAPWQGEFAFCSVLCLLALNSGMYHLLPPIGWVDPGLYIFNFLNLTQNTAEYGPNYHSTRIPFVFVGWLSYRIFEPVLAQQVLANICYLIGLGALLCVARTAIARRSQRLIFVLAIALSPIWIRCFTEGYVDGLASAFALLGVAAALPRCADGSEYVRGFASGAAAGLAVATHPVAGIFAITSIALITVTDPVGLRRLSMSILGAICGGLSGLFVLAVMSFLLGGPFFFFVTGAEAGARLLSAPNSNFALPASKWVPEATRAVLVPLTLAVMLAAATLRRTIGTKSRVDGLLLASFIALGFLALAEFNQRGILQFRFYASYLLIFFIPLCALIFGAGQGAGRRKDIAFALTLALLLVPVWRWAADVPVKWVWTILVIGCLLVLSAFVVRRARLGLLAVISATSLATATDRELTRTLAFGDPVKPRLQAQLAARIRDAVVSAGLIDHRVVTWFNRGAADLTGRSNAVSAYQLYFAGTVYHLTLFDGATATFGWDMTSLGFEMPKLDGAFYRQAAAIAKRPTAAVLLCIVEVECRQGAIQLSLEPSLSTSERLTARIDMPNLPPFHLIVLKLSSAPKP